MLSAVAASEVMSPWVAPLTVMYAMLDMVLTPGDCDLTYCLRFDFRSTRVRVGADAEEIATAVPPWPELVTILKTQRLKLFRGKG